MPANIGQRWKCANVRCPLWVKSGLRSAPSYVCKRAKEHPLDLGPMVLFQRVPEMLRVRDTRGTVMEDFFMIFLITDFAVLVLVLLFIWQDTSMPPRRR